MRGTHLLAAFILGTTLLVAGCSGGAAEPKDDATAPEAVETVPATEPVEEAAEVAVPDAVGFSVNQVQMLLDEYDLVGEIQDFEGDPATVDIVRQDPEAGTMVAPGTTVLLWTK